jgi:hypothetical protein
MIGLMIWSIDAQKSIEHIFDKDLVAVDGVLDRQYVARLVGLGLGLA